ncbi:hypothetical protein [Granulicella arctica]|uniref:Uncharacterized protein n=1 Tax=Granulicella arctica TaxID=940613 RepID=A0A7Y9PL01_9BACT|nr:hypothetical protein [Granulicella arctica]NYF81003.1 hypothetical protein [Granulicella arctica]
MGYFVVFGETSGPIEPSEGTFDDPAFGQHLKAFFVAAFDHPGGVAEHLLGSIDQDSRVAAIDKDSRDGGELAGQPQQ